jgi:transposase
MGRRGRYSDAFKREAVELVQGGRSIDEVAVALGVAPGTLWHWVAKARGTTAPGDDREVVDKAVHDAALKRIAQLEAENDFLGKASAYFAEKMQRKTSSSRS